MRTLRLSLLGVAVTGFVLPAVFSQAPAEAPTGFDNLTNGFTTQTQFDADKVVFEEREGIDEGLGPVFNAQSCAECHQNPVTGAISQVTELRAGHFDGVNFVDHPGGSLINDRAIDASIQERVFGGNEVRTFRTSLNTVGDGFVEAIDSNTLVAIANGQPSSMRGQFIEVRLEEPAREPAVVLGRCVPERDGHHERAATDGEHLQRQLGGRLRPGGRPRRRRPAGFPQWCGRTRLHELHAGDQGPTARHRPGRHP